jgi:hypothetical protein
MKTASTSELFLTFIVGLLAGILFPELSSLMVYAFSARYAICFLAGVLVGIYEGIYEYRLEDEKREYRLEDENGNLYEYCSENEEPDVAKEEDLVKQLEEEPDVKVTSTANMTVYRQMELDGDREIYPNEWRTTMHFWRVLVAYFEREYPECYKMKCLTLLASGKIYEKRYIPDTECEKIIVAKFNSMLQNWRPSNGCGCNECKIRKILPLLQRFTFWTKWVKKTEDIQPIPLETRDTRVCTY